MKLTRLVMNKKRGFTLVEMAVVLVVIGLVLSGILSTFQAQMDSAKIRETRQSLADIREGMIAFALNKGYLPCPANPTLAFNAAGAGIEDRVAATGLCNRLNGVVPWATLGVKELDAWGGRFSYSVSDEYIPVVQPTWNFARKLAAAADPCDLKKDNSATFNLCSEGRINIRVDGTGTSAFVAEKIVAVIVSHGKNRRGSFNREGGGRIAVAAAAVDELQNANANTALAGALDIEFVSRPFVYTDNQLSATYYDDLTEWIPITALVGRMVSAGKLP